MDIIKLGLIWIACLGSLLVVDAYQCSRWAYRTAWGSWDHCTATCGCGGIQYRYRYRSCATGPSSVRRQINKLRESQFCNYNVPCACQNGKTWGECGCVIETTTTTTTIELPKSTTGKK